ncbi:MAG TPA: LysM peptidoglycan-binding domain-containing protein [Actinomycetota bacterium]|nr:LysM peptidoglycan-binding domain-containing protein [Actinomycetota bacterium]
MPDRTEPFEPYEPDPAYDWDMEPEEHERPRILWGRLVALGVLLILVFLGGRACAPEGVPPEELDQARARIEDLEGDNDRLRSEIAALEQAQPTPAPTPTEEPSPSPTDDETTTDEPDVAGETYVVQEGDTLTTLAEEHYGDGAYADELAAANDLAPDAFLDVGQELFIPDEPPQD